jgi:hypothetical protein
MKEKRPITTPIRKAGGEVVFSSLVLFRTFAIGGQ